MTKQRDPAMPMVNLNGDARETLQIQYRKAIEALGNVGGLIGATCPHGRNYQHEGADYLKARTEHEERIRKIYDIQDELVTLYRACE